MLINDEELKDWHNILRHRQGIPRNMVKRRIASGRPSNCTRCPRFNPPCPDKDDGDRQHFLEKLGQACAKTGWQVQAYCLMPNHSERAMAVCSIQHRIAPGHQDGSCADAG